MLCEFKGGGGARTPRTPRTPPSKSASEFEERRKWRYIHSSTENEARAVWMNDASQTKIR
jgi:hypothetical protein